MISFKTVSAKSYGYGIKRCERGVIPSPGEEVLEIFKRHKVTYIGNTNEKSIYLTFDAGYETGTMSDILDILLEKDVTATFFLTGHYIKTEPDLVRRMVNEGHIVGNHSYNHLDFTKSSKEKITNDIKRLEDIYNEVTGEKMIKLVRPPEGTFSEESLSITDELGYHTLFWSIAYIDWDKNKRYGWEYAYQNVCGRIHNGAIILMHSVSKDNLEALPKIIDDLRSDGYKFSSITSLIS